MSKITLRWYQQQIIDGIYKYWRKGLKRILAFSCTRSGKTIVFWYMSRQANDKGNKVLILTNRRTLFKQTGKASDLFGVVPYYINADNKKIRYDYMTYLAMSQTLERRLHNPEMVKLLNSIQLVVIDEAHLSEFDKILKHPLLKDKFMVGVTGSPVRSGNMPELIEVYQQIVIGPYTAELEPEYCIPARVFEIPFDMSGVSKTNKGEYNNDETFQRFDSPTLYKGAVSNWKKRAEGLVTLGYCVSITHCLKTAIAFNEAGIKCKFISSGKTKPKLKDNPNKGDETKYRLACEDYDFYLENLHLTGETEDIIEQWRNDEFLVLLNVNILTFGFDESKIRCILFNRATLSIPFFLQAANRGGTPEEGKDEFILLDQGGNSERLKDYNHKHEWSLVHKKPTGGGVMATKECVKCHALIPSSARVCDQEWGCGTEQPKSKEQLEIELVERITTNKSHKEAIQEFKTVEDIEMLARVKKYSKLWIFRTIYFKLGEDDFKAYMKEKKYKWPYIYRLMDNYK